jgi:hypothetical protein
MMALVHDLAEAQGEERCPYHITYPKHFFFFSLKVGDIAPREGIPKAEKHQLESVKRPTCIHQLNLALLTFSFSYRRLCTVLSMICCTTVRLRSGSEPYGGCALCINPLNVQ